MKSFVAVLLNSILVVVITNTASWLPADELPAGIVDAERVEAATELVFTEGPSFHRDGSVYFTEIANNRIMRLPPGADNAETFIRPSGRANGMMFDAHGNLLGV